MASNTLWYQSVKWIHTLEGEPVLIVSELDSTRTEIRKIEYFKDGAVGIASGKREINGTRLSVNPIPSIESINHDPQFEAVEISKDDFEIHWNAHI